MKSFLKMDQQREIDDPISEKSMLDAQIISEKLFMFRSSFDETSQTRHSAACDRSAQHACHTALSVVDKGKGILQKVFVL